MNRVLIVAGERQTGERYQQSLGLEGFQTAVVGNPIQMVEFCRQHTPDFLVIDLELAELGLWSALQALREIVGLAQTPCVGIAKTADPVCFEKARSAGFLAIFPSQEGQAQVVETLHREVARAQQSPVDDLPDVEGRDPSLNRLREIARDIVQTTASLRSHVSEYGEDGPELFGYIESSGAAIRAKLNEVADFSLHDKELRHDFRNMIGSVTGFAELILMEEGLTPESTEGLRRLRQNSRDFVEVLDQQKAEARA